MEGGVIFKVRSTQDIFLPKWWVNTNVDPSKLDPNLKVIISQCDILIPSKLFYQRTIKPARNYKASLKRLARDKPFFVKSMSDKEKKSSCH